MALVRTQEERVQVLSSPSCFPGPCARTQAVRVTLFPLRWGQVLLQVPLARWQFALPGRANSFLHSLSGGSVSLLRGAEGSHKSIYSSVKVLSTPWWL